MNNIIENFIGAFQKPTDYIGGVLAAFMLFYGFYLIFEIIFPKCYICGKRMWFFNSKIELVDGSCSETAVYGSINKKPCF